MPAPHAAPAANADRVRANRLTELDALRGLCALAVALYHYTYFLQFEVPGAALPSVAIWWGCDAVRLFFAISGFAILATLERTGRLRDFARARAGRLLPEYWLALSLTGLVALLFAPTRFRVDPVTWLWNLPSMQMWTGTRMVDGVYWTLNVEIGFYIAMALLWRLGALTRIERMVLGWMAVKWLFWIVPVTDGLRLLFLTDHAAYFGVGLIAHRIWIGDRRWQEQLPIACAVIGTVFVTDDAHALWLVLGMVPLFFALSVGRVRWLAHPWLEWLGSISYAFYLLHGVIGYTVMVRLQALEIGADLAAAVALAVALGLAALTADGCERWRALARRSVRTIPAPADPRWRGGGRMKSASDATEAGLSRYARRAQ